MDRKTGVLQFSLYKSIWSFEPNAEKKACEELIAFVMERRGLYPDLHIYRYAPYEQTAIMRLAGRHGTCADPVDQLLRAGVFVDFTVSCARDCGRR